MNLKRLAVLLLIFLWPNDPMDHPRQQMHASDSFTKQFLRRYRENLLGLVLAA